MIDSFIKWIQCHAEHAHFFIFIGTLLAGLNIPIPIDLLMITSAILAAMVIPSHLYHLFFAMLLGCIFSAWISYWLGRKLGPKITKWPLFASLFSEKRMASIQQFYARRGPYALILGRFIPFGVRNGLFMSSGMGQMPFRRFLLWDGIACTLWSSICFSLYYTLGKNIELLYTQVKMINLILFIAFSVTGIGLIWYKKKKNTKEGNV